MQSWGQTPTLHALSSRSEPGEGLARAALLDSRPVSLTPEDVRYAAALAHIALEPDELDALARDLAGILDHIGRIAELDLADVPPTSHALDLVNVFGEDVPREPWPREQLLELAPERTADGFLVPPIGA